MLALIRRLVALLVLLAFAALCSGAVPEAYTMWLSGTPKVQFIPLLLSALHGCAVAIGVLGALMLLTRLFGRVYCSWLCPLGILQDIVNRLVRPRGMKAARYTPNHPLIRACFALLAALSLCCGASLVFAALDPYTSAALAFGTLKHLLLTGAGEEAGAWRMGLGLILLCLALPLGMAAWRGRLYCNTVCPVGAVLGLLARYAPFAPKIDKAVCRRCGACLKSCKAHAIDLKRGHIDRTRCVGCYDCTAVCQHGALTLRPKRTAATAPAEEPPADPTRRAVLGLGALGLASALLPLPVHGEEEQGESRSDGDKLPILPPGAGEDRARFLEICTGCGLCIANCPTGVLRPSLTAHGWNGFLKPYLDIRPADPHGLEEGRFCRFDCNRCSSLCPTGALAPLSLAQKQRTRIALAQHTPARCIPWQTGYECGHCAAACPTQALTLRTATVPLREHPEACTACRRCVRVCPQGAITLVSAPTSENPDRRVAELDYAKCIGCGACAAACRRHHVIRAVTTQVPTLDPERCIGCGACTAHCPATPQAAVETRAREGGDK